MASELFIGQGNPRPRLFLLFLLLFLILGTCLASAVTGADYVRGSGSADVPDERLSSAPTAFSAQDDRCLLVAVVGAESPQAFLLWRLRPALAAMSVTAFAADTRLPDDSTATLADRFGDGGRIGCEAVCGALAKARYGTPTHYIIVTEPTLRALMNRLGDTLTLTVPEGWELIADGYPGAPLTAGRQAMTAEQLISFLSVSADDYPGGRAAFVQMRGAVWAALCERYFAAARVDKLPMDFAALVGAAQTDLGISHFVRFRDALIELAAHSAGEHCPVSVFHMDS